MKKLTLLLLFCCAGLKAQNLTINETIDYINDNVLEYSKIEIDKTGILSYTAPSLKYTLFDDHRSEKDCIKYKNSSVEKRKDFNDPNYKTYFKIHISDLELIEIEEPSFLELCFHEWQVIIKCKSNVVFHINQGDCISVKAKGWNPYYRDKIFDGYKNYFRIPTKNGEKSKAEKVKNALIYLTNLAKEKGYNVKENEEYDPFSSNNFNKNQFEIKGKKRAGNIQLTSQNGVYYINISIGNISKKFILDTGASDVLISKEYERQLIQKGYLKKEHYITDGLYRIADGSIIKSRRLLIPELEIGGFVLTNVRASVVNSGNTMLLGQSVLDKFSSWNINNLTKTLELKK